MGTKVTIHHRSATSTTPGFHLYWDCLDEMAGASEDDAPIYLSLDGVAVELKTSATVGASVTITLPRELARELGLLRLAT